MTFAASGLLPCLTADLPGVGGQLKEQPEDFVVEEIPAYHPTGSGEHLFLWIEKRDVPHDVMLRRIARTLGVSQDDVGTAGIKDRRAVTRQYVSVPAKAASQVALFDTDDIQVLSSALHGNKLRTGHLRGNRFSILAREVVEDATRRATAIAEVLRQSGFPNYYGEQRFGHDGQTLSLGLDLLAGRKTPRDIPYQKRKFLLRLALSSVQSDLFNRALARRMSDGLLNTVLDGDVMEVIESGGKFIVDDAAREQGRLNAGELAVTGPMFGAKMLSPRGVPAEHEAKLLAVSGLELSHFANYAQLLSGTRRAFTATAGELTIVATEDGLRFDFTLSTGTYATMLLREFMKTDTQNDYADVASHGLTT